MLAFLLISHVIFRNYGNISPIVPVLETRFWTCFDAMRQEDLDKILGGEFFLLWLAFTGATTGCRLASIFEDVAVKALRELRAGKNIQHRLDSFEQVRVRILDLYLWS